MFHVLFCLGLTPYLPAPAAQPHFGLCGFTFHPFEGRSDRGDSRGPQLLTDGAHEDEAGMGSAGCAPHAWARGGALRVPVLANFPAALCIPENVPSS